MVYDYDVVVCGAGPAGASASLFLSQQGISHLVIDKSIFPRPKVCGDGLTPCCFTLLEQVIPDIKAEFSNRADMKRIKGVRLYSNNGKHADLLSKDFVKEEKDHVYTVSRTIFDDFLVKKLVTRPEATFWSNTHLQDYTLEENGIQLTLKKDNQPVTIHTKLMIAADGDRSLARKRAFGTNIERKEMVAAIRTYYRNVLPADNNDLYEVYALKEVLPGYLWVFPMADGTYNVGLGITSDIIQEKKLNLRNLLTNILATHPSFAERFKDAEMVKSIEGSGLPLMMETEPILSTERILLTGDAGSLADPISGEGIGPGIVSGKYAALTAASAVRANDFSMEMLRGYDRVMHQKITKKYELRIQLFDWFIKHPWKIEWIVWATTRIGWVRNFFANSMNNYFTYSEILNPLRWKNIFGKSEKI